MGRSVARLVMASATAALFAGLTVRAQQAPAPQPVPGGAPTAAARPPQGAPPRPPKPGETSAEYFKNIKVLKDLPAEELRPTMEFIAASLGVRCDHCHVVGPQGGFDKDEKKPKETAREMLRMVTEINTRAFEGRQRVGCATCHHGRTPPERTPPLATEMTAAEAARAAQQRAARGGGPGGPPPGAAPGQPGGRGQRGAGAGEEAVEEPKPTETIDQVVDKYVQALGGHAALAQAKTRVMKGTATLRDLQTAPVTVQETATGQYRQDLETAGRPTTRATDGKAVWMQMGPNTRDLEGLQAQQATRLADFSVPLTIKEHYKNLTVSRYSSVDGTDAILVTGRPAPDVIEQLFFDKSNGLLLRRVIQTTTSLGNLLEQVDYADYHDVSGVKVPFQVRYATWNDVVTEKFTDVKLNTPIEAAQFAKPAGR
jgi:hypothetical protein